MALSKITAASITDNSITNTQINSSAAIAKAKLASLDIVNADINASAAIASTKLGALAAANMPASSIVKIETQPITDFGLVEGNDVNSSGAWVDLPGTEKSFTRSISTSKILVLLNLKVTSYLTAYLRLHRKIGSGAYAVVGAGASGTDGGRTSNRQVLGAQYNYTSVNAMGYGIHADQYTFLDEVGEGLTDSASAITYKIDMGGGGGAYDIFLNIDGYNDANYNSTTESSYTFMEIKV